MPTPRRIRRQQILALLLVLAIIIALLKAQWIISKYSFSEVGEGGGVTRAASALAHASPRPNATDHRRPARVAFVTFSYVLHNDTTHLTDFLFGAANTWVGEDEMLFVVFSESSRDPYEKACQQRRGGSQALSPPSGCERLSPIFVDCPEGRFGESPCCKQEKGLLRMLDAHEPYEWYGFFDDDVYLRREYIADLLSVLPPERPAAAIPRSQDPKRLGRSGYLRQFRNMCSSDIDFTYPWGMPIFYSRAALLLMERGYRAGSLVQQCNEFQVTHDVGNALLNWMYGLPVARLPPGAALPRMRGDFVCSHWVGRKDKEKPGQDFSFPATHRKWTETPHLQRTHPSLFPPQFQFKWYHNASGFRRTRTFQEFGDPSTWDEGMWHTIPESDCRPAAEEKGNATRSS